jgi:hypothetical protein
MSTYTIARLALAVFFLSSSAANAQVFRAYVASGGSDANACTLSAPCRLLPKAISVVASGGEIWMLDSANYNTATVTVDRSVSILAVPGVVGSVLAISGPAISIAASDLKVALRNLVIAPLAGGGGTVGVNMTGASTLTIENSLLANLPQSGIVVSGSGTLNLANSTLRNNGLFAVAVLNGATATISGTQMLANAGGVQANGSVTSTTTTASVSDSVIAGGSDGVHARTVVSGATARISVTRSTIERTSYALLSFTSGAGTAAIAVSGSMIVNNVNAWHLTGAGTVVQSLGNNHFTDNATSQGQLSTVLLQ